jgi:hypothetical protein
MSPPYSGGRTCLLESQKPVEGITQKRQCHTRVSGHPDLAARAEALDSRLRGNDKMLRER